MADEPINPLVKLVEERLPWLLLEHGFRILDYRYDSKSFGNCLVLLESPALRLRFIRDRGITTAELAARTDPETWYDAGLLLSFLNGGRPDPAFEGLAVLLKQNWKELDEALGTKLSETKEWEMRRREETKKFLESYQREFNQKLRR